MGPRFYDADSIQPVYELSHVVNGKVQVTHSDDDDGDYYYYYDRNNYDHYFVEFSGKGDDSRLPPRSRRDLRSSGILRSLQC